MKQNDITSDLNVESATLLPEAFKPMGVPSEDAYNEGYNDCLEATDAANLWQENQRLKAGLERKQTFLDVAAKEANAQQRRAVDAEADRGRLREALVEANYMLIQAHARMRNRGLTVTNLADDAMERIGAALAATDP